VEHIAVDLGGRESQVCVRDAAGLVVEERRLRTDRLSGFLRSRAPGRVIVETCAEAFAVADAAVELGHQVRVVPSTLVRSLGVGARGVKTDQRDARILSEVSARIELPSVHVPSQTARKRKALCASREALVSTRTKLINHCRGWQRQQVQRIRTGGSSSFVVRMKELERKIPRHIEAVLEVIDVLQGQIDALDGELLELVKADEVCVRLMTVPGVGPVTAMRFVAAIDEVARFGDSHALQSYLGLVPGERSSGDSKQRTGLTKAGNAQVRWALTQAAWSAWRYRSSDPMVVWAHRIAQRRGKHVAVVALARKLAGILYALWRDGTRYDASRGAQRIDADGVVHSHRP
jgi:transposase